MITFKFSILVSHPDLLVFDWCFNHILKKTVESLNFQKNWAILDHIISCSINSHLLSSQVHDCKFAEALLVELRS